MKLSYLIKECTPLWERSFASVSEPGNDPEISSIHSRVQDVKPGGLFIAIKGFKFDGHDFVDKAFKQGAVVVIAQKKITSEYRIVEVKDTRRAMASISARFFGKPSESMTMVGITGTNGKTTTTWILESILKAAGHVTGVIGTVNWRYNGKQFNNPVATPESMELQKMLKEMKDAGVSHVIMEVSSHGIDLHRVRSCSFDVGVFTNLSQDHLDYHKTMKRYFHCKKRFFTKLLTAGIKASSASAVINVDDQKGREIAKVLQSKIFTVSAGPETDIHCKKVHDDISGIEATIGIANRSFSFKSELIGRFNLENILCAAGAAQALGIPHDAIKLGIESCKGVPGRLERISHGSKRFIFVDYAHTPDALESSLKTLKMRAPARVISVFGCGGDRDRSKRSIMGSIGVKYSNLAIVTSDNPRTEDPMAIIDDILEGINDPLKHEYIPPELKKGFKDDGFLVEPDRKKALGTAVKISEPEDVIIAAGKGHETYQILKNGRIDFYDGEVLENAVVDCGFSEETA